MAQADGIAAQVSDADDDAAAVRREREWLLSKLRRARVDRVLLDEREHDLVKAARIAGIGWPEIAEAIGTTADAALAKHGEPEPGEDPF